MFRIDSAKLPRTSYLIGFCLLMLGALVFGCSSDSAMTPVPGDDLGPLYKVTRVTDGDTIRVDYGGMIEKVRLIAIDTPEVDWYGSRGDCFGDEAGKFTRQKLAGERVHLVRDGAQPDRDRNGRLLRFVVLEDGTNFNALLVSKGFATYESQYPVAEPFLSQLENASDAALASNAGLWSACR